MGQVCQICGKGRTIGHNVSYSKRRTRRIFMPNLRWITLPLDNNFKRVKICMKCLKRIKKEKKPTELKIEKKVEEAKKVELSKLESPKSEVKKRGRPKKKTEEKT